MPLLLLEINFRTNRKRGYFENLFLTDRFSSLVITVDKLSLYSVKSLLYRPYKFSHILNPPPPFFKMNLPVLSNLSIQYTLKIKKKVFPNEKFAHKITQHVTKHVQ